MYVSIGGVMVVYMQHPRVQVLTVKVVDHLNEFFCICHYVTYCSGLVCSEGFTSILGIFAISRLRCAICGSFQLQSCTLDTISIQPTTKPSWGNPPITQHNLEIVHIPKLRRAAQSYRYGSLYYKPMTYYKPTPLFRADVRKIAHGLIIRTIRYI